MTEECKVNKVFYRIYYTSKENGSKYYTEPEKNFDEAKTSFDRIIESEAKVNSEVKLMKVIEIEDEVLHRA